jgi:parvulin-like peptidyl-prolyl isomerase
MRARALLAVIAVPLLLSGCGALFQPTAAVVNGKKITIEQIDSAGDKFAASDRFKQLAKNGQGDQIRRQFEQTYLSALISRAVIEPLAASEGVSVSDADVQQQIDSIKKNFPSDAEFQKALADQAVDEAQLPDLVRAQLLETRLRDKVTAASRVPVKDLRAYYQAHIDDYREVGVFRILLKGRALATQIALQLQGTPVPQRKALFQQLAKQDSKDPSSASKGGDLGVTALSRYKPALRDAIRGLRVNEVSDAIKSPFGFEVLMLVSRDAESFAKARSSIENQLMAPQADKAWTAYIHQAYLDAGIRVNPRYGQLDVASRQVVDTPGSDVPGSDIGPTPTVLPPGQPQAPPGG